MTQSPIGRSLLRDDLPLAVILVEEGEIRHANAAARALAGATIELGAGLDAVFDAASVRKIDAALGAGAPSSVEVQLTRAGADPLLVHVLLIPVPAGALLVATETGPRYPEDLARQLIEANDHLVGVTQELARRTAELERARDHLETLGRLRDQFVAALSHDVRSPLSAVALTAAALREGAERLEPAQVQRHAARIQRNVARVVELVDHVLEATRIDHGGLALARAPVSLAEVAREAVDAVEPICAEAGVHVEIAGPEGPAVEGDRVRLFQVIANLLGNAIRHAPRGSTISIELETTGDRVRCAVRDRGPGVPAADRDAIFERFRIGGGRPGAAGLGLHIAHRIVEAHEGRIWVEDAEGGGARFVVELPVRATVADDARRAPPATA